MSDITKCAGTGCPLKESCYRHKAKDGMWQSYFKEVPYNDKTKNCQYFWELC